MRETRDDRVAAVKRVVLAARAIASDASLARSLVASTGLSRQGVELALSEHLETHPSDEEIFSLVDRTPLAPHAHVILSANVFIAPLRAIACARAAAPVVSVQSSSREPIFANALIESIADPSIFAADHRALHDLARGEVHVYGRAETIDRVRAKARPGIVVRGHGPGLGIAYIMPSDDLGEAARDLARDVIPFDQRGCLSPRVAFVVGDRDRAEDFSEQLSVALGTFAEKIPRGSLTQDESLEGARYLETIRFAGEARVGRDHVVGFSNGLIVPPTGRYMHITYIESVEMLAQLLAPLVRYVTVVGSSDAPCEPEHGLRNEPGDVTIRRFFSHSVRSSRLGKMQKPPFDGPVDLRA